MGIYNTMRLILMFDLPSIEAYEKKEYLLFRKALLSHGYIMMQFSIYTKFINVQTKVESEINKIKKFIPTNGNIRVIAITEKQYQDMYVILGHKKISEIYNSKERYIKV